MSYTNEMRQAVHALDNPTSIDLHVSQKGEQVFLLVEKPKIESLNKRQAADFFAYVTDIKAIIRLGGGGNARLVVI